MAQAPLTLLLNNDAYPLGDALRRSFALSIERRSRSQEARSSSRTALPKLPDWSCCRTRTGTISFATCRRARSVNRSREALGVSAAPPWRCERKWFLDEGGFDESFVNGFEDVDLCMRAREQGRAIEYVADARFAHYEAASENRFAREAENERRFYARWSARMARFRGRSRRGRRDRVRSGGAGDSLLAAAPRGSRGGAARVRPSGRAWRDCAVATSRPAISPRQRRSGGFPMKRRRAASPSIASKRLCVDSDVRRGRSRRTWLPCAALSASAGFARHRSAMQPCKRVGVVGGELDGDRPITPEMFLGASDCELACVVHSGSTDEAAFGNVLLAQAGIPAVVLDNRRVACALSPTTSRSLRARCASRSASCKIRRRPAVAPALRRDVLAADARRRFSPRRSAIRVVDLLCAARFGLERPQRPRTAAAQALRLSRSAGP